MEDKISFKGVFRYKANTLIEKERITFLKKKAS